MAVVTFIMVNVLERNGIILVKEDFLSYLQEVYFKVLYVYPELGKNVQKCNNVRIVPLVSMATETRDPETSLEKATPVLHRVIMMKHAYIAPHTLDNYII